MINSVQRQHLGRWSHAISVLFILVTGWIAIRFLMELRGFRKPPSVYLVLASTRKDNYTWATNLSVPNMHVIPYVADDQNASFHPPANKGNEAMMYLTYLYDFYDYLPDISIFTHASESGWHNDAIFDMKISHAIEHLDLEEVRRRKYVNLKIGHMNGCPAWINTTISFGSPGYNPLKLEEPYVKTTFEENFGGQEVPEIFASPCCSQFAVAKDAIRRNPRAQYKEHVQRLLRQTLDDHISGRVWEHLWQYIFLGKAVECPNEHKTLCSQYHICFQSSADFESWNFVERQRTGELTEQETGGVTQTPDNLTSGHLKTMLDFVRNEAMERGKSKLLRDKIASDL